MALEGALVGYAVTKLLDQVLTAIYFVKDSDRNLKALCSLLERLQPLVTPFCTSGAAPPPGAVAWLITLEGRLKEAGLVVQEWKTQNFIYLWKTIRTARKVIKVTEAIKELLLEAGAVVLTALLGWEGQHVDAAAEQKRLREDIQAIGREFRHFQGLVKRMNFSLLTRKQLDKSIRGDIFGHAVTTTGSLAFAEIKGQADIIAASYSNLKDASNEVAKVSMTAQGQSSVRPKVRETIFGGDEVLKPVKELLLSDENDKWIGLWSMGGAGKTLTAQRLYKDPSVQQHFVGGSFWLTVSKERNITSLIQELCEKVTGDQYVYDLPKDMAKDRVTDRLRNKEKVLLVLDDVWSSAVLDDLDVLQESCGNRIFVTTRNVEILKKKHAKQWSIPLLSPLHSWQLFCLHAFDGEDKVPPPLETCARQIVEECGGLPLALKVIGGTMAGKRNRAEWNQSLRRLQNADTIDKDLERQLYDRLQLSVDDLPGIHKHLKDCFYYFAAFPEDYQVWMKEDLLALWKADGIVGTNSVYPPEDEAFELLGWLIARSLIELDDLRGQAFNSRGDTLMTCKIHDVLRDLARVRRNLQHDIQVHERVCLYQAGIGLERFPEDWTSQLQPCCGPSPFVERISVMHNNLVELPTQLTAPRLRILLMNHNDRLRTIPKAFLEGLPQLRVLDLSNTGVEEIPATALSSLKLLMRLNLSFCGRLLSVPDSIQQLTNLKDLNLSYCRSLNALPDGLRCLTKLQTLDLSESNLWDVSLESREACTSRRVATLDCLNDLPLLEYLFIFSKSETEFVEVKLKLLRHLNVVFDELQSFPDISELACLETVQLRCQRMTTLPHGTTSLSNLKILFLQYSESLTCLPALDELPVLELLDLSYCTSLTHLPKSFGRAGAFPSLQDLRMIFCHAVRVDGFPDLEPGAMVQLLTLDLSGWRQMRLLPTSLQSVTSLRILTLGGCSQLEGLDNAFQPTSFPNLEELKLPFCRVLTHLPESLASSQSKLVKIDLEGCPARHHLPRKVQELKDMGILKVLTEKDPMMEVYERFGSTGTKFRR